MNGLLIGQLAKESDVNITTIRYYERRGLMPEPERRESGYRVYPPESVTRLRFIKHAQTLGFVLTEIEEMLALRVDSTASCDEVKHRTKKKVKQIDEKIRSLEQMRNALTRLMAVCDSRSATDECPILEALEEESFTNETNGQSATAESVDCERAVK